jgi:predicted metalloprotease
MAIGGGSAGVVLILALISQVLGVDVTGMFGGGSSQGASAPASDPARESEEYQFVNAVLDDVQTTFEDLFQKNGKRYRHAKLDVFTQEIDTGCGRSSAAVGPFYCPPDQKAYIDLSFFQVLRDQLGADGDFAEAYVLAHEIGHHVQNLMGIESRDSVRVELQADCFAGVWGHSAKKRGMLENGDIDEALNAAAQIGDDRLQKMGGGDVNPETFTHGTSAQRSRWFKRGFDDGRFEACDTFSARDL